MTTSWSGSWDLGILYPTGVMIENARGLAWQLGLEFDGHASRGWLGSSINIRVRGEEDAVRRFISTIAMQWSQ